MSAATLTSSPSTLTPDGKPAKRSDGSSWNTGVYVRYGERELWNSLYEQFEWELREFPGWTQERMQPIPEEQRKGLAHNLATIVMWELRD